MSTKCGRGVAVVKKKWTCLALVLAMLLSLSGCLFRSPQELYRQPEKSAGYGKLNEAIRRVRTSLSAEFGVTPEDAGIVAGDNTANIQLVDLDGDGSRESAITFLRVPGVEKPIKIYVFTQVGEEYVPTGVVEGEGTAIYAIDYYQINGERRKELVVNWQISSGVYQLGIYTLDELSLAETAKNLEEGQKALAQLSRTDLAGTELLLTRCSVANDGSSGVRLMDLDQDTHIEVAVVRLDAGGLNSHVELYAWRDSALVSLAVSELSDGMTALTRIRANYLAGEYKPPALYVTGTLADGSRVIDVVAWLDGRLQNLAMGDSGVSREITQIYTDIQPTDINGDAVFELPSAYPLPTYGEKDSTNFWLIDWGQYDSRGRRSHVRTTYHNVTDGWYLETPESWRDKITISRNDQVTGQREVIFSYWRGEDQAPEPFLSIYRLPSSRSSRVTANGWLVLREEENVIYAAKFHESSWNCGLNDSDLLERFKAIRTSWYNE